MKKRLRKKLHLAEFQELGFEIAFKTTPLAEREIDTIMDAFIDLIEESNLECGGGCHPVEHGHQFSFFVTKLRRGSVTPAQRQVVAEWASKRVEILEPKIGELQDAWYGY